MLRVSSVLYLQQVWERTSSETELQQVEEEEGEVFHKNNNISAIATNVITNDRDEEDERQRQQEEPEREEQGERQEHVIQPVTATLLQIPDASIKTSTISRSDSSAGSSIPSLNSSIDKNKKQTTLTTVPVPSLQHAQHRGMSKKKKASLTNMKRPNAMSSFATTFASETRKLTAQVLKRNTQQKHKHQVSDRSPLPAPSVLPKNNTVAAKKQDQPKTDKSSDMNDADDDDDSGIANSQGKSVEERSEIVYTQVYNQEQDDTDIYNNGSISTTSSAASGNNGKNKDTATTAEENSEESGEDSGVAASTSAATSSSAQQINAAGVKQEVGDAASRRATQLYHFYYDDDENNNNNNNNNNNIEQERRDNLLPSPPPTTNDTNVASVVVNDDSSGGTSSSMPPTPTSIQRQQQSKQNDTSSIQQYTGKTLRREASRLSMKRKNITKKLKKAMSFQKPKKTNEATPV